MKVLEFRRIVDVLRGTICDVPFSFDVKALNSASVAHFLPSTGVKAFEDNGNGINLMPFIRK